MATSPNATPTPITPPRVAFIDPRTGLITREWYLFFLSLYRAADTVDSGDVGPSAESLIAAYDEALRNVAQFAETQPPQIDCCAEIVKQLNAVGYGEYATWLVSQVAEMQKQVQALEVQPALETLQAQIAELQKQVEGLQMRPPPREFERARYGQFYDTTTQVAAAINTAYGITFNTTDVSYGVTIGSPTSRVYVDETAVYNFLFSIQLDKTSGGTANFWVWPRINGVDVPDSNSQVRIQGNDAEQLVTVGYFFELNAGDYVEIMYAVSDTSVQVQSFAASAFYPAIPSIILTVSNNIKGVQ